MCEYSASKNTSRCATVSCLCAAAVTTKCGRERARGLESAAKCGASSDVSPSFPPKNSLPFHCEFFKNHFPNGEKQSNARTHTEVGCAASKSEGGRERARHVSRNLTSTNTHRILVFERAAHTRFSSIFFSGQVAGTAVCFWSREWPVRVHPLRYSPANRKSPISVFFSELLALNSYSLKTLDNLCSSVFVCVRTVVLQIQTISTAQNNKNQK